MLKKFNMKILILDNYDSFTYNLVHYVEQECGETVDVFRNDKIELDAIEAYDKILLSPGPGLPSESGILMDLIKRYAPTKDILGVCLGHQAISEAFGGTLYNLDRVMHGIATKTILTDVGDPLFDGLPPDFLAGRYHSWAVSATGFPSDLKITAYDENGTIMACRHTHYKLRGVQFHPESVLTEHGHLMIRNWLKI